MIIIIIIEHVFTLKSLLERLKRDFDYSKILSLQFTSKLYVDGVPVNNRY